MPPVKEGEDEKMKLKRTFALAMALTFSMPVFGTAFAESTIDDGLLFRYTFDTAATDSSTGMYAVIPDMSGNGNNATVLQGAPGQDFDVRDGCGVFPGVGDYNEPCVNQYNGNAQFGSVLKMPDNINKGVDEWSMSMWVSADDDYTVANIWNDCKPGFMTQGLFNFWSIPERDDFYDYDHAGGSYTGTLWGDGGFLNTDRLSVQGCFYRRFENNDVFIGMQERSSSGTWYNCLNPDGLNESSEWVLVTYVYKKNDNGKYSAYLYTNGILQTPAAGTPEFNRTLKDFGESVGEHNGNYIGRLSWGISNNVAIPDFKGMMDDIRMYNRALKEDEVKELYETTAAGYQDMETPALTAEIDTSEAGSAVITLANTLNDTVKVVCAAAAYDADGKLKDIKFDTADVENGAANVTKTISYTKPEGGSVSVYVWNCASMMPYAMEIIQ